MKAENNLQKTSVAMCTYNGEKYIRQQLDTILNQTVPVDEIIICDDGSSDQTIQILEEYCTKHPEKIRLYHNESNLRSVKNFEKALSLCNNDIIFLSDQDDEWMPDKVQKMLALFLKNPSVDLIATNGFGINEDGETLDTHSVWDIPRFLKEVNLPVDYFKIIALSGNIFTGASMALRKSFAVSIMPFPEIHNFHHDEWLALMASFNSRFIFSDEKLFRYRRHNCQQVGNVFFPKDEDNKKTAIKLFDYNINAYPELATYKKMIKILCGSYQKNIKLSSIPQYEKASIEVRKQIEQLYQKHQKDARIHHPISWFFIDIADNFLGKRRLKVGE